MLENVPSGSECQSNDLMFPSENDNEKENTSIKTQLETEASTKAQDKYKALPLPKSHAKATAAQCRDTLHEIKSMTYIISDDQTLKDLNNQLQSCLRTLQNLAPTSNGLIMERHSQTKQTKKVKSKKMKISKSSDVDKENKKKYKQIPNPLKKKHPYTGRVGAKAGQMREHMYVNMPLQEQDKTSKRKRNLSHTHGGKKSHLFQTTSSQFVTPKKHLIILWMSVH
jgi:small-conductance mechanosensitive channel